ncbi:hypothetical protein JOM56_014507 [Amanita muscaria]
MTLLSPNIALSDNQHVERMSKSVDRQTRRLLRRECAQVWERREDGGKIFIEDVKSRSNGTFITDGECGLSQGVKSEPLEVNVVEFGIDYDIVSENETTEPQPKSYATYLTKNTNGAFNFPGALQQRRTQLAQQGLTGMGGMGDNIRPPGKGGLSFDLIFRRLQGKLQKSKATGAELHNLMTAFGEIQDMLGGSSVQQPQGGKQHPSSSAGVIATHGGPPPDGGPGHPPPLTISLETLLEVQAQLQDTQSSLASHIDKIRSLESILAEQDALKQEMRVLCDLVKAQLVAESDNDTSRKPSSNFDDDEDGEEDDAKSVMTVTARDNLERIDEEDEERMEHHDITEEIPEHDLEMDEEKHRRREELGRPKTPEPTIGIDMHAQSSLLSPSSHKDLPNSPNTNSIEIKEQVKAAVKLVLEAHCKGATVLDALQQYYCLCL